MSTFFSRFRRKSQEEKAAAYGTSEKRSWSPFKNWKKPNTNMPKGKYDPREYENRDEDDYEYPSYEKPKAKMPTTQHK